MSRCSTGRCGGCPWWPVVRATSLSISCSSAPSSRDLRRAPRSSAFSDTYRRDRRPEPRFPSARRLGRLRADSHSTNRLFVCWVRADHVATEIAEPEIHLSSICTRLVIAALLATSLMPAAFAEPLGEHPAVLVARAWTSRPIDPNTLIVAHPARLELLSEAPVTARSSAATSQRKQRVAVKTSAAK